MERDPTGDDPPRPAAGVGGGGASSAALPWAALGALAGVLLVAWTAAVEGAAPRAGEGLLLRWSRTAVEQPLRTWLALTLALVALRPRYGAPRRPHRDGAGDAESGHGP